MVTFNPRKPENTTGPGRIKLGEGEEAKAEATAKPKWVLPVAIGGGLAVVGLAGYFMLASGGDDVAVDPKPLPPIVQVEPERKPPVVIREEPKPPVIVQPQVPSASQILAESLAAKSDAVYLDRANAMYDAYISGGREARPGQDFSTHVGLFKKGGISVLITEGPHAGARIGFMPFVQGNEGRMRVTYERVGKLVTGADGRTPQFVLLPESEQVTRETILGANAERQFARQNGFPDSTIRSAVTLPGGARKFEKQGLENGQWYPAFWLHGSPEKDGVFTVEIWNGDSYSMNLNTGEFTVNSVYLFHPDVDQLIDIAYDSGHPRYRQVRSASGCSLDPNRDCNVVTRGVTFPNVVNGVVNGIPAPATRQEFKPSGP